MSEPTYTIALTESERTAMARVLGALVTKLINAPLQIDEAPNGGTQAARAVLAPPPQNPLSPSPAAAHPPTPELRDRWARDRKGNDVPNPEGCESVERYISKLEDKPLADKRARMIVGWPSPTGNGFVEASCFDSKLFPWLILRQKSGEKTVLHVVKKGKYLNIVGVRA